VKFLLDSQGRIFFIGKQVACSSVGLGL
jgi:hypothetical protein